MCAFIYHLLTVSCAGCDDKTYGVNCETPCGHCRDSSPCDVVNGHCSNGCEDWYSLDDNCKTSIRTSHACVVKTAMQSFANINYF